MANNELTIILQAVDNVTAEVKKIQTQIGKIGKETGKTGAETEKHTNKMAAQWVKAGLAILGIRNILRLFGNEIKNTISISSQWDRGFKKTLDDFQIEINNLKKDIGDKLKPVITDMIYWLTVGIDNATGKTRNYTDEQRNLVTELEKVTEQLNKSWFWGEKRNELEKERLDLIKQLQAIELDTIRVSASERENLLAGTLSRIMDMELQKEQDKIAQLSLIWNMYNQEKTRVFMAEQQKQTELYTFAIENQKMAQQSFWAIAGQLRDTFSSGLSDMFMSMVKGTFTAKEAFAALGEAMLKVIIDFLVQRTIAMALSKAMLAMEVGLAVKAGAEVALAWADAAAMTSLASFGANLIPASSALIGADALAHALALPEFAEGGIVNRPTIAMIGEAGPEAVIPLSRGGGRMGQYFHIEINNPIVRSDEDIDRLTEEISLRLAQEAERL